MISQHIKKKINQKFISGAKCIRLSVGLSPVNPLLILQVQVKDVGKINKCDNWRRPYPNCQRSHWDASEWWSGQSIEWASQSSMLKGNTKTQKSPRLFLCLSTQLEAMKIMLKWDKGITLDFEECLFFLFFFFSGLL